MHAQSAQRNAHQSQFLELENDAAGDRAHERELRIIGNIMVKVDSAKLKVELRRALNTAGQACSRRNVRRRSSVTRCKSYQEGILKGESNG